MEIIKCDKCGRILDNKEPHWHGFFDINHAPKDMKDDWELDYSEHYCLDCKPLGEYTKTEKRG